MTIEFTRKITIIIAMFSMFLTVCLKSLSFKFLAMANDYSKYSSRPSKISENETKSNTLIGLSFELYCSYFYLSYLFAS
jgi:hypothetical protein